MKKKILSMALIATIFVFLITGCGTNSGTNNEDSEELFATVSAEKFYDNVDNDFYKQYINKKITITNLTADGPDYISYKMAFAVICNNQKELPSDLKGNVSVTGVVSDSDMQNGYYLQLKNCTVE